MFVIEVPEASHSNNELMRQFAHPQAKRRERDRVYFVVRQALLPSMLGAAIDECEITVTRYGRNLLDFDNMGGGLKFWFDALVNFKVLTDDKPRVITRLTLQQQIDRKNPRTVFLINPLEEKNER